MSLEQNVARAHVSRALMLVEHTCQYSTHVSTAHMSAEPYLLLLDKSTSGWPCVTFYPINVLYSGEWRLLGVWDLMSVSSFSQLKKG